MVFDIKESSHPKITAMFEKAMKELDVFFELNWIENQPRVVVVPDRKTFDLLYSKKTDDWLVGWCQGQFIYLLSPETFNEQSSHTYSDDTYFKLIKHELTHSFTDFFSQGHFKPLWLIEGIAIYLSGQLFSRKRISSYSRFIDSYSTFDRDGSKESGFAVEFLIQTYGKEKILSLFKALPTLNSKESFAKYFKELYGFDLEYNNFKILS